MMKTMMHAMINGFDKKVGVPSVWMHHIVDVSLGAIIDLFMFMRLATHRQKLPSDAQHLARIITTQGVDCGTCVQVTVNLALNDGLNPEWILAALERRPAALPAELQDIYHFTHHILAHDYAEGELRETLRARYGERGLVDLAFGIASAQVFPLTKQVLGFAMSCSKVQVSVGGAAPRSGPEIDEERPHLHLDSMGSHQRCLHPQEHQPGGEDHAVNVRQRS